MRRTKCNSWSRRDFLRTVEVGALGALAGGARWAKAETQKRAMKSVKVDRVEVFPVRYPTVMRFKFFEGPKGTPPGRPGVLVKVTADDGSVGWGESVPVPKWSYETLESATTALKSYLGPAVIGRDPYDLVGAHGAMDAVIAASFTKGMPIAKAGLDMALHDLAGKLSSQSLAQRWGRSKGGPVTLSWTLNPKTLDQTEEVFRKGWERGFRNFNVKVAPDPKYDLELCRQTKKLCPEGFLWADANGGYDLATALEVIPKLADLGVAVMEQPLDCNRLAGYRELKKQSALPIIMDEGVITPADLIEFIRLDMLDGLAMKPARTGGLLQARRQIEILEDAGLMFLGSGLTDPDVSLAASLALYGAYGLKFPAALNGPQFLGASVVRQPLVPKGGKLDVPDGPGLGVEVEETKIKAIAA